MQASVVWQELVCEGMTDTCLPGTPLEERWRRIMVAGLSGTCQRRIQKRVFQGLTLRGKNWNESAKNSSRGSTNAEVGYSGINTRGRIEKKSLPETPHGGTRLQRWVIQGLIRGEELKKKSARNSSWGNTNVEVGLPGINTGGNNWKKVCQKLLMGKHETVRMVSALSGVLLWEWRGGR